MNKVILNSEKILDNIIEGYSVKATRMDGYEYIISMELVKGEEIYKYQFGRITREFKGFDALINKLSNHEFLLIEF